MNVEVSGNQLVLPRNKQIEAILTQHGAAVTPNGNFVEIDHNLVNTMHLRAQGFVTPAPVLTQYDFPASKPAFITQKITVGQMTTDPRDYVLNGIGTGKTRCTLWAFAFLKSQGLAQKLIVFAPISTLYRVWVRELTLEFPDLTYAVLYGEKKKRLEGLAKDVDIYIVNHDGQVVIADELAGRADIDCICIDELSVYRNGASRRTKFMRAFAATRYWCWGLTGSPIPRAVSDVWGQCTVVTPWTVPKYFSHLRQNLMYKDGPFKWKARPGAEERALRYMHPSVRFTLDDVVELPPKVIQYVEVPMGPRQHAAYNAMRTKSLAMIGTKQIDALNAGAVLSKMLQIALGWVYTRDKSVITLDNNERLQTIIDYVDQSARKVLIFVPFKSALAGISAALTANDVEHGVVSGDTPMGKRNVIFGEFQEGADMKVLVAHPACMAHGLTLTAADTVIWAGPITSLEISCRRTAGLRGWARPTSNL